MGQRISSIKANSSRPILVIFYVVCLKKKKLDSFPKRRLDGTASGGLFGSAVMVLGDLDQDGFKELAVSAPNEGEGTGVVYIYTFDNIGKSLVLMQTIWGKEISLNLKGFGISFSRGLDIDDNGFLDFAVGAPFSDQAVLLRTIPTVTVYTDIRVVNSLSKSNTTLTFKCCYYYASSRQQNLMIIRNVTVDQEFYRFYFRNHIHRQYFEEKTVEIKEGQESCEDVALVKLPGTQNYNDSITIELTYKLPRDPRQDQKHVISSGRDNDTFCKECAILGRKSVTRQSRLVIWDHNCEHLGKKEPCKARMEINARFVNLRQANTFTLGSKDPLNLDIELRNRGDPAYSPFVYVHLPNSTVLSSGTAACQILDVHVIKCDAGEVLEDSVTYHLQFNLNPDERLTNVTFFLRSTTITENISDKSSLHLPLMLFKEADFLISGYSKESTYLFDKQASSTLIQNIYKIDKFGPSPTPALKLEVVVPYKFRSLNDGSFVQFAKILTDSSSKTSAVDINSLVNCSERITTYRGKLTQMPSVKSALKGYSLSCAMESVACALLDCTVGPFEAGQGHAEVSVDIDVDFRAMDKLLGRDWLVHSEQIIYSSIGVISTKNFQQTGNMPDTAEVLNVVLLSKEIEVSLWILIGSAGLGLVILVCVTVGLAKAGFFERKEHQMLLQLKEEALKEEQILEEMIQKEMDSGGQFQGDPVFRYIEPKDLESYWTHLEDKAPSRPLLKGPVSDDISVESIT